jgi:hypothetical protein
LQIVPVVSGADLTSISSATANFTLSGTGFIEGNGTMYQIGTINTQYDGYQPCVRTGRVSREHTGERERAGVQ